MKLQNKLTGKIGYLYANKDRKYHVLDDEDNKVLATYETLDGVAEEWEDYEEPKKYWYIDSFGEVDSDNDDGVDIDKEHKQIGNYFETEEEAEKAVEKLKAWKRLKDKGFRFTGIGRTVYEIDCAEFDIGSEYLRERDLRGSELNKDLDLLFGGEE